MKKLFVISLGGSLIIPDEIDINFLKKFKRLILKQTKKGQSFIIVTGGGRTCRKYQQALKKISKPSNIDLDWMGIYTNRFNAQLVRLMFGKYAHPIVDDNIYKIKINTNKKIIVASGGYKPGRSSDGAMIQIAKIYKAGMVVNLSNIDFVYTKDPKKFRDAKKIEKISWTDFRKIVGNKWNPGVNLPFDPTAAKDAEINKIKVIIANGKNLKNLENILEGKKIKGTLIG